MEKVEQNAIRSDPLLACCMCDGLLQRSVLLSCLHNYCQQCFSEAASKNSGAALTCCVCGEITHPGAEQPNRFLDLQVKRYRAMAESGTCGSCRESGVHDKLAAVWCPQCQHSLCGDCLPAHGTLYRNHCTQLLKDLKNSVAMLPVSSASVYCLIHNRPLEIACLNCEKVKCLSCWAECYKNKHEMHVVYGDSSDECVKKFTTIITSIESDLLQKSAILQKTKSIASSLKEARSDCMEGIEKRKRLILEAVEEAYLKIQYSAKTAFDKLEKETENAAAAAERIERSMAGARSYAQRLVQSCSACDIFDQQKCVQERLIALSAELDKLSAWVSSSSAVLITSALPDNVEHVVAAWIGALQLPSAGHSLSGSSSLSPSPCPSDQKLLVDAEAISENDSEPEPEFDVLGSVQLSVDNCLDVSPTSDGRLLLAFGRDGLIEINSSGDELSRWQPPPGPAPPHCGGGWPGRDEVHAVTVLSSGQVVVALYWSRVVLLLKKQGRSGNSALDDTWVELRRLSELPWRPQRLSAHGDLLAASGYLRWGTMLLAEDREQVMVASYSWRDGWCWTDGRLNLDYRTCSLAVTPKAVVTASSGYVTLSCGRKAHVLDAYSRFLDKRLWRRDDMCGGDEEMKDVCADTSLGVLYAAVCKIDASGGRLAILSLNDGSELQRVALRFVPLPEEPLLLPMRLSLGDGEQSGTDCCVLAVLCWNPAAEQHQTVMVCRAADEAPATTESSELS